MSTFSSLTDLRLRNHNDSIVTSLKTRDFTEKEIELVIESKNRSVYSRRLLTDFTYILIKEKSSSAHATASRQLEAMVAEAIVSQLLVPSDEDETFTSRIRIFGDGGTSLNP